MPVNTCNAKKYWPDEKQSSLRFEVLAARSVKMAIFWDVPCCLVDTDISDELTASITHHLDHGSSNLF
jgi:hypothetical protein